MRCSPIASGGGLLTAEQATRIARLHSSALGGRFAAGWAAATTRANAAAHAAASSVSHAAAAAANVAANQTSTFIARHATSSPAPAAGAAPHVPPLQPTTRHPRLLHVGELIHLREDLGTGRWHATTLSCTGDGCAEALNGNADARGTLGEIAASPTMLEDHLVENALRALDAVADAHLAESAADEGDGALAAVRRTPPPRARAAGRDVTHCACCAEPFDWALTTRSAASAALAKFHCRACGGVVCDRCSLRRVPLAALPGPQRVCDRCYFTRPYAIAAWPTSAHAWWR